MIVSAVAFLGLYTGMPLGQSRTERLLVRISTSRYENLLSRQGQNPSCRGSDGSIRNTL